MTATIETPERDETVDDVLVTSLAASAGDAPPDGVPDPAEPPELEGPVTVPTRPLLVAACSSASAALTVGGIFGSWGARLLCLVAAAAGIGWAYLAARSPRRRSLFQGALPIVAVVLGVLSLTVAAPGGPSALPDLVADAIESGRRLRPPIPFDAGWRPILIAVFMLLGFTAAVAGVIFSRPRLSLIVPLPLVGVTAISQPPDGQALAGVLAVLPVIAGLTVLFGTDGRGLEQFSKDFELRRVLKAAMYVAAVLVAVVLLNTTSVLFPAPAYDPAQQAQKPKPIPLSATEDKVLFEITGPITGPWKMGSLDEYDGEAWRLPPFEPSKLERVPADGVVDDTRTGDVTVSFTVRDLGTNATLPGVTGPTKIEGADRDLLFDPRAGAFRVPSGRVPAGLTYTQSLPTYPTPDQLRAATAAPAGLDDLYTDMPPPPPAVRDLLAEAPPAPWDRLDFLLKALTEVEIAVGEGAPKDVPPRRIQQILAGNHEGSPYELVAARAMLARWAGVPARIGFGFDGVQDESGVLTVRPKNAAQWLEVYFEGHGWIPIVTQPPRAKASLDNDESKFNPTIEAGSDVAVKVYIPVKVDSLVLLYQRVRAVLVTLLPIAFVAFALYLATPWMQKTWRRAKRRRWAASRGAGAQIAVEYCEFRDLATDLGIGDPFATPIEYLDFVVDDDEHDELGWLVTKALYGEMRDRCEPADVAAARELVDSLRARMMKAQPFQTRVLAVLTKLSLQQPYSTEVPNVTPFRLRLPRLRVRLPRRLGRLSTARSS